MKITFKRIISITLALLMVVFCFPVTALGTDELEEPVNETLEAPDEAELSAFERGVGELGTAELENMTLNAADVPEVVTTQAIAEKDHVLRLYEQEEDLNTVIFQNRDGGKTVYLYANPVKYVDDDGNVKDRSTALTAGNVIMGAKIYAYSATDNSVGQYYPTQPQNGVLLAFGEYFVEMTPVITGILTLRDTTLADNKVTYNKVFGNGTSLVYTPTLSGVKEDIILQAYTGKSSFSFTVKTNGLAIIQQDGDTFLADFEGNKVASLGKVIVTDSANHTAYGSMTVATKTEREEYTVTVNAPTAFLTSRETVYPVTVDPTLYISEQDVVGENSDGEVYATAIEDLCIYYGSTNPGSPVSTVGNVSVGEEGDVNTRARMLYRITPEFISYNSLSYYIDSSRFASAKLNVKANAVESDVTVTTCPYSVNWTSGTTASYTYLNYDNYESEVFSTTTISNLSPQTVAIDVTDVFEYWAYQPSIINYGIIMMVNGEGGYDESLYNQIKVYQTEDTSSVYFTIDYGTYTGEYYINNTQSGHFLKNNGLSASPVTNTYTGLATQKWNFEYAGNGKYYIISDSGTNNILYASGTSVRIGTKPANPGDTYKWTISMAYAYSGYFIRNASNNYYLFGTSNDAVGLSSTASEYCDWRLRQTSAYVPLTNFSVADIVMGLGETTTPTIAVKTPTNATWANLSDFSINLPNGAKLVNQNNTLRATERGSETITFTHKPTGVNCLVDVAIVNLKIIDNFETHVENSKDMIIGQTKEDSENSYNTISTSVLEWVQINGIIARTRTNIIGGYLLSMPNASSALSHFLDNSGSIYTVDCSTIINDSTNAEILYNANLNAFKEDIQALIKSDGEYKVGTIYGVSFIESKDQNDILPSGGDVPENWWFTLGAASAYINATVIKEGNDYTCQVKYYLCDFYDWEDNGLGAGLVSDAEMKYLHETGYAKEFEVTGLKEDTIVFDAEE